MGSNVVSSTLEVSREPARITLNDFMTGFLAALAAKRVTVVSIRDTDFYAAVVQTFEELERRVAGTNLNLRFWLTQDATHGDAPEVREGITKAVQRDLISLDNPTYQQMRLRISEEDALRYLERVPGGAAIYLPLADVFMDAYPSFR